MKLLLKFSIIIIALIGVVACIEDGFSDSPSDQPIFSVDTLNLGTVFTDEPTPTSRFVVHNRHPKSLLISDISLSGANADCFRLNVDGMSGKNFSAVEIRSNDSIFILVEATLPVADGISADYEASLDFITNGVKRSVAIVAHGQNVERLHSVIIDKDTHFSAEKPYQIYDSLVVAKGATLTLDAGTTLCFHDKSMLIVRGKLISNGTPENPVNMSGDRTGNVVGDISFDIMSRQWIGVFFTLTSKGNVLKNTIIRNTSQALTIEGTPYEDYSKTPQLYMLNCRLRNSGDLVLEAYHSNIRAIGCEFAEASTGLVYLQGGSHNFNHCTFANYYLFTVISGPAIQFAHISDDAETGLDDTSGYPYLEASFSNCIIYGLGNDVSHGDLTGTNVFFNRCLLKGEGENDDNFIDCLFDEDPLYYTVRDDYYFDYRLKPESPAIGAANPSLTLPDAATDGYGLARGETPDLGAYVFNSQE
ncbi:MAG: hypothetical protein J1F05_01850 [Muribaculaceae bacterium]|nr:hypothetical protein [Muribaculaceae bacterium]